MEKKRLLTRLGGICLALVLVATFSMPIHAQPIELKFAHYSNPGHPMLEGIAKPWAKMVEEKTNGKVKITIYPAQTLVKMRDTYDGVVSGIADIAYGLTLVTPGRFPLSNVITIPFSPWTTSSELASQVVQKLYVEGLVAKEWKENPTLYEIQQQHLLNSKAFDFAPAFADKQEKTLVFSRVIQSFFPK